MNVPRFPTPTLLFDITLIGLTGSIPLEVLLSYAAWTNLLFVPSFQYPRSSHCQTVFMAFCHWARASFLSATRPYIRQSDIQLQHNLMGRPAYFSIAN